MVWYLLDIEEKPQNLLDLSYYILRTTQIESSHVVRNLSANYLFFVKIGSIATHLVENVG